MKKKKIKKLAEKYLTKWQPLLRLQDWEIDVKVFNVLPDDSMANIDRNKWYRTATIQISKYYATKETIEGSIIHELLHLYVDGFHKYEIGSIEEIHVERMINTLEELLLTQ